MIEKGHNSASKLGMVPKGSDIWNGGLNISWRP